MKKLLFSMGIGLFLTAIFGYANQMNQTLSDHLIRMHIVANSNTEQDQLLKLKVRDEIIKQLDFLLPNRPEKREATKTILTHQDLLLRSAKQVLENNNCYDPVTISYGKQYYPQKSYSGFSFPAGEYDSFQIQIGEGQGENWWCVMYPSFGAPAEEMVNKETLQMMKQELSKEEYELVTSDKPSVVLRFKTVDYLMRIKEKMKSIGSELLS